MGLPRLVFHRIGNLDTKDELFDVFCFVRADQMPIYCSLHYFAFTPEVVLTKGRNPIEFHRESGSRNLLDLDNCEVCSTPYSHNPRN